ARLKKSAPRWRRSCASSIVSRGPRKPSPPSTPIGPSSPFAISASNPIQRLLGLVSRLTGTSRLIRKGFVMRRLLLALTVLFAWTTSAQATGLLIPTEKTLPPLAMLNHKVEIAIEDQVA